MIMFRNRRLLALSFVNLIIFLFNLFYSSAAFGSVTLVDAKLKNVCPIVIPAKANLAEQFKAKELQYHLAESTGLTPPIKDEPNAPTTGTRVFLDKCAAATKAGFDSAKLELNACLLKTRGNDVLFTARTPEVIRST